MRDQDVITALNDLIETSKDGQKGFALAARSASDPILIHVFTNAEQSCREATAQLQDTVRLLGGRADDSGSMKAAAHRGWLSLKSAMSARDNRAILAEREKAEDYAKARYSAAIGLDLPEGVRVMIERQYQIVVANHNRIMELRDRA